MFEDVILTCEHASNAVPSRYAALFTGADEVLRGHRGWDPGALPVARSIAARLGAPLFAGPVSRLLIDLNRSPRHPRLFSEYVRRLPPAEKQRIIARYYEPYRHGVASAVSAALAGGGRVLHLSVHSFTPVLSGHVRTADVGLLYDPRRPGEREFCARLRGEIATIRPSCRVRRNYPYRGTADGLTTHFRRIFPRRYCGVEIELNQERVGESVGTGRMARELASALERILTST